MTSLPVLVYQKIGTPPANSHLKKEWTSSKRIAAQLSWLSRHHFTSITPLNKISSPRPVMLIFMGGYQSFYTEIFPLLKKYQFSATLCIATDTLGTYNAWQNPHRESWQNILTAQQLSEIYQSGLVQIASLGLTGNNLLEYPLSIAQQDFQESIYRLKRYHKIIPCAIAFWPNSRWDKTHLKALANACELPVISPITELIASPHQLVWHTKPSSLRTKFKLWKIVLKTHKKSAL